MCSLCFSHRTEHNTDFRDSHICRPETAKGEKKKQRCGPCVFLCARMHLLGWMAPTQNRDQDSCLCAGSKKSQQVECRVPLCVQSSGLHGGDCTQKKEETGSGLRTWLLEQFAWGHLSTMQIQKIAELAVLDARSSRIKDLDEIGQAGTAGRHATRHSRS